LFLLAVAAACGSSGDVLGTSTVVHGTPDDWYKPYGWRVVGCENGSDFTALGPALHEIIYGENPEKAPRCLWYKTRKGREYGVYDNKSHGAAHKANHELFWETKRAFGEKYNIEFTGFGQPKPDSAEAFREQPFHRENVDFFADYEELEWRDPVRLYDRPSLLKYMTHCREKVAAVVPAETEESLRAHCGFERRRSTRAELHVFTIRHIQHHAAQLILRLRVDAGVDVPWLESGWREA